VAPAPPARRIESLGDGIRSREDTIRRACLPGEAECQAALHRKHFGTPDRVTVKHGITFANTAGIRRVEFIT